MAATRSADDIGLELPLRLPTAVEIIGGDCRRFRGDFAGEGIAQALKRKAIRIWLWMIL